MNLQKKLHIPSISWDKEFLKNLIVEVFDTVQCSVTNLVTYVTHIKANVINVHIPDTRKIDDKERKTLKLKLHLSCFKKIVGYRFGIEKNT
jgi:hypothetical protein